MHRIKTRARTAFHEYGAEVVLGAFAVVVVLAAAGVVAHRLHQPDLGTTLFQLAVGAFVVTAALAYVVVEFARPKPPRHSQTAAGKKPATLVAVADLPEATVRPTPVGQSADGSVVTFDLSDDVRSHRRPSPGESVKKTFLVNSYPVGGPEN